MLIIDDDCLRSQTGHVIAWLNNNSVYDLVGYHLGWFEDGILYDDESKAIGFVQGCSGVLPSQPLTNEGPRMPVLADRPSRPVFSEGRGRSGGGDWSNERLDDYFA